MVQTIHSKFLLTRLALMHDCSKKGRTLPFLVQLGPLQLCSKMGQILGVEHMLPLRIILQDSSYRSSRSSVLDIYKISFKLQKFSTKFQKWEDITDLIFHCKSFITHRAYKFFLAYRDLSLDLSGRYCLIFSYCLLTDFLVLFKKTLKQDCAWWSYLVNRKSHCGNT